MADLKASRCSKESDSAIFPGTGEILSMLERRGFVADQSIMSKKAQVTEQKMRRKMYHNTQLMLKHYRDIVWALECFPGQVAEELNQPLGDLDALLGAVDTQLAIGNMRLEHRMQSIKQSRVLLDRINDALTVLQYHQRCVWGAGRYQHHSSCDGRIRGVAGADDFA